ncbi:HGxxPAAW family protein [Aestuariimicrobium ganziense]|uniref:HGxxPAAW family protein n=1 Tax=Aestuariimicrobium ganziense TaxID=2773677 RepID=UPI0019408523|nr:HGxxPAAW family protein [Aestuariimicrobium ganziense]
MSQTETGLTETGLTETGQTERTADHVAARSTRPVRHYHHGRNPAAWTGVILSGIGFLLGSVAAMTGPNWTLVWISGGLVLAGLVAGGLLKAAGYGNN